MPSTINSTDNQYIPAYKALQEEWKNKDKELWLAGKLAYWTYWISKHAEKSKITEEKSSLFSLKRNGLLLLSKSRYVQIRKFIPTHHKRLCVTHSKTMRKSRTNPHIFIFKNKEQIKECSECQKEQEHYYSLYSVALLNEIEDIPGRQPLFVMYSPYEQLKNEFPELDSLESVKKYYGSELCTVSPGEKKYKLDLRTFRPEETLEYFVKSYNELSEYISVD